MFPHPIVNTGFNHKRMLDARGPDALNVLPDFALRPCLERPSSSSHTSLAVYFHLMHESCRKDFLPLFHNLLAKLNDKNVTPVTSVVSDVFLGKCCCCWWRAWNPHRAIVHYKCICHGKPPEIPQSMAHYLPALNDANNKGQAEANVNRIPGMKDLKDIMSVIGNKEPKELIKQSNETASRTSALLLNHIPEEPEKFLGCDIWEQQPEYIQWLNSKEPKSVIFATFGSTMFMSAQQLVELVWKITESNHYFLWVIRPDMVRGDGATPTQEFLSETNERGLLRSWCQQEAVLNHPSVGGFIKHCGEKGKELQEKALKWKKLAEDAAGSVCSLSSNWGKLVEEVLQPKHY